MVSGIGRRKKQITVSTGELIFTAKVPNCRQEKRYFLSINEARETGHIHMEKDETRPLSL